MPVISTGKYLRRESVSPEGQTHQVIRCVEEEINSADGGSELKWILYMSDLKPLIQSQGEVERSHRQGRGPLLARNLAWVGIATPARPAQAHHAEGTCAIPLTTSSLMTTAGMPIATG